MATSASAASCQRTSSVTERIRLRLICSTSRVGLRVDVRDHRERAAATIGALGDVLGELAPRRLHELASARRR